MKITCLWFSFLILVNIAIAQYKTTTGRIAFTSTKGMMTLEGVSEFLFCKYDTINKDLHFKVQITSFNFTNCSRIVEKTFNDVYMESHKYHWAKFDGKIINVLSSSEVEVEGNLDIHGKKVKRKIIGVIFNYNGKKTIKSEFIVSLADHNLKVLFDDKDRLAEEVKVTIFAELDEQK